MKKKYGIISDNVKLFCTRRTKGKKIDYFILLPNNKKIYAFTKPYTQSTYELCKAGISLKTLLTKRTRNTGIMNLVNYTSYMMPYFIEEGLLDVS